MFARHGFLSQLCHSRSFSISARPHERPGEARRRHLVVAQTHCEADAARDSGEIQDLGQQSHRSLCAGQAARKENGAIASKRIGGSLLRRVYFDLIGLPPTPEEVDAFAKDDAPDAYEKVVDRLLASPRHGERWARHWLDVSHFAETHGHDQDVPRPNAWPYRDYLIKSFNDDKPYRRFIEEQIAGGRALFRRSARPSSLHWASSRPGPGMKARSRTSARTRSIARPRNTWIATTSSAPSRTRFIRLRPSSALAATITSSIRSRRKNTTGSRPSSPASIGPIAPLMRTPMWQRGPNGLRLLHAQARDLSSKPSLRHVL